ncbi:SoxR reducing system RseC family protein [Pasteurellaceae bacterium LIM206]|nr:SoxR reducing system RseC family protein [Pasteurellaceae bacterium LIM206]
MLTESAVVIAYSAGVATVKCQAKSACGSCSAKSACGTSALSELTGETGGHILTVETITPLKVGQTVEIGLAENALLTSALLAYLVPLLVILFSTVASESLFSHEFYRAVFIFFSTALSFFLVKFWAARFNKKSAYKPILLRVF